MMPYRLFSKPLHGLLAAFALAVASASFSQQVPAATGAVVTTEQVRAELLAHAPDGAETGKTVWLGLQLTHKPQWHTYWKNPGDSGLPTELTWALPEGISAGAIAWPLPRKIPIGNLANYGYEDTVLLPVPLTITPAFKPSLLSGGIEIKLKANWLVCKQECIPEEGSFILTLPTRSSVGNPAFDKALQSLPVALTSATPGQVAVDGKQIRLAVNGLPAAWRGKNLDLFPETPEVIATAAAWKQAWDGATWTATVPLSPQRSNSPQTMPVVLALGAQALRTALPVTGNWPTLALVSQPAQPDLPARSTAPPLTLITALLGALLGGLILNLMPCVFPVLAIKLAGFASHARDRRAHRVSGLAYSAGVVCSFLALGALVLGLRGAGESLGWGFQLQEPAVVAALALLFTLIGLNLSGLFEFASILPSSVASMQARHPVPDAFLTGVLAVAVASPCTAPFMGASLGFAIGLPVGEALAIFAAIGVGLALPYLVASFVPAFARLLPRPGAWMDTLRKLLAFPMYATVAWLVWVLGQQSGIDGAGALLLLLVAAAWLTWALTLRGQSRWLMGLAAGLVLALLAWTVGPYLTRTEAAPVQSGNSAWEPWEPGRVEQLLAKGEPVFVDFTAAWCVTCQYNKQTTLGRQDVMADFAARKVHLLRADWTLRDPAITAALRQLGRNGVPVYVLYQGGRAPVILSEILSYTELRTALAALAP